VGVDEAGQHDHVVAEFDDDVGAEVAAGAPTVAIRPARTPTEAATSPSAVTTRGARISRSRAAIDHPFP
jgi:hypothetical protein